MTKMATTRKAGRPSKDNSAEVGLRYGMLVIQAILPAIDKGGQRVLATCDCGRQTETRLNRLKTAEPDTKSCGCLKIAHYKAFLRRSVDHLSGETVCAVWTDHFLGQSRFKIARAKGIAVSLVDECIRTYQTRVNTMVENRIAGKVYLAAGDKGGVEAAAAAYSLPLVVARYLTMVMSRKKPAAQVSEITYVDGVGMICEMYYNLVAERAQLRTGHQALWRIHLPRDPALQGPNRRFLRRGLHRGIETALRPARARPTEAHRALC